MRIRFLPTAIVALVGAIIGSFLMMLYASTHFTGVAGPGNTPPVVSAAPLTGISDQDRIISAVKRAKSSVVAITVTINGKQYVPVDPFLQQFFGGQGPGIVQPYQGKASGSGFVYDGKGDIVTNAHVLGSTLPGSQVSNIQVTFANGERQPAHVVSVNVGADLAVIKVDNYGKLPSALQLADSDRLQQGQWAIAIGEPLELQQSVSLGIVSAFNRTESVPNEAGQRMTFKGLLQTTAPINPGNSGGPLVDIDANVIGVNQLTASGAQGIGFAIPSKTVKQVVDQLIAHPGTTTQGTGGRGFLGVQMAPVTQGFRDQTGYRGQGGVGIIQVVDQSPADQAGLQAGDVILSVNGKSFASDAALRDALGKMKPGTKITMQIWSRGVRRLVSTTLSEFPAAMGGP